MSLKQELEKQRRDKKHKVVVDKISDAVIEEMRMGDVVDVASSGNKLHCTWQSMKKPRRTNDYTVRGKS